MRTSFAFYRDSSSNIPKVHESERALSSFSSPIPGLVPCPHPTTRADVPQLTRRLSRLEGAYIRQATEAARISNRAEHARLHYSEVCKCLVRKAQTFPLGRFLFLHFDLEYSSRSIAQSGAALLVAVGSPLDQAIGYVHAFRAVSSNPQSSPRLLFMLLSPSPIGEPRINRGLQCSCTPRIQKHWRWVSMH